MPRKESDKQPLALDQPAEGDIDRMADDYFTAEREEARLREVWQKAPVRSEAQQTTAEEVASRAVEVGREMAKQPEELPEVAVMADIPAHKWHQFMEALDSPRAEQSTHLTIAKEVFAPDEYKRYQAALQGIEPADTATAQTEFDHAKTIAAEPWPTGQERQVGFEAARGNISQAQAAALERKTPPPDLTAQEKVDLMRSTFGSNQSDKAA